MLIVARKAMLVLAPLFLLAAILAAVPVGFSPWVQVAPALETRAIPATETPSSTPTASQTPQPTDTATATPTPTFTATASATPTWTPSPSATATASSTPSPSRTATATLTPSPLVTFTPEPTSLPVPAPMAARGPGLVLCNYVAWYDGDKWGDCNISAGDSPQEPYHSDDAGAIGRHVRMAQEAGIQGFTLQWFAPGERTDRNMETLLAQSQGTSFRSTVVFLRHIWHGSPAASQENVAEAIRYLLERYGKHPNFLTHEGKPVLIFCDMYRVPKKPGQTPVQAWAAIRNQVDPQRQSIWIAEGLDASYLEVFDGLYVYKITHVTSPNDYTKDSRWASNVHAWEQRTGQAKLWIGTVSPGWDDLRSKCRPDLRGGVPVHKRSREDGAFYRATFDAAMSSGADWLWINSFNEWVEGTYIEPSRQYGDLYMRLTREFAQAFGK